MGDINLKAALGGQIVLTPTNTASNYTATFPAVTGVVSVQASASYTTGSVLFVNSSGQIAQNNSSFFWDNTNKRLGIGTATPSYDLDISANGANPAWIRAASSVGNSGAGVIFAGATATVKNWIIANQYNVNGALEFTQTTTTGGSTIGATPAMILDSSGNVNIATSGVSAKLYVNGNAAQNISALGSSTGTVTLDLSTANNFSMTLTGIVTLANPSNITAGQSGVIFITNGSSSAYTMSFGTYWDFPNQSAPSLTATTNAVDVLVWTARSTTSIAIQILPNIG